MSDYSVGVEEEYQLVDSGTGALVSRAPEVLRDGWTDELQPEMQQTMVEVGTAVCRSAAAVRSELERLRLQAAAAASTRGLAIVAAGLHPNDAAPRQWRSPGERYARIAERLGRIGRTDHIFGMHVHVAVPSSVDRLRVIGVVRAYIPHLVALAASSPLYGGEDTGFASYRTILAGRLPTAGIPPALECEAEFARRRGRRDPACQRVAGRPLRPCGPRRGPPRPEGETLAEGTRRLLECVAPAAEAPGDGGALPAVERMLARPGVAERIRRMHPEGGVRRIAGWLAGETMLGVGMDRRGAQRRPGSPAAG